MTIEINLPSKFDSPEEILNSETNEPIGNYARTLSTLFIELIDRRVTTDTARELAWLLHQTPRVRWRGEIGACITKVNWSTNRLSIRWILPENRELHTPSNIGIPSNFTFWRRRRRRRERGKRKITIPLKDSNPE